LVTRGSGPILGAEPDIEPRIGIAGSLICVGSRTDCKSCWQLTNRDVAEFEWAQEKQRLDHPSLTNSVVSVHLDRGVKYHVGVALLAD
jgi:hypothetical protein